MDTEELQLEGRRLAGRYRLESEVASGGMGTVWRALDEVLGRPVAVKVLHDRLARDPDVLERFRLEAVAAARLSHPCVVRVFDTGIDDGVCFIVMELLEGHTLEELLEERGALPPGDAARVVRSVLQGLAHAHREGVIHRDVKPGNVMVDPTGLVKVTDFGIAKAAFAGGDLTTTGSLLGTVAYLAPEQVAGEQVDGRSDLYAVGVVLYELLTGRPPFQGDSHIATATMRLTKDPVPPGSMRPGISRGLDAVVKRSLSRQPDQRFQTAEEMGAALDREAPPPTAVRSQAPERPAASSRSGSLFRSWMMVPLLLLVAAALAVGGYALLAPLLAGDEDGPESGPSLQRLDVADAFDHDPAGDFQENPDAVDFIIDGDRTTSWISEGYEQIDLGGKGGVGIGFDFGGTERLSQVRIRTDLPGWQFELYAGDSPGGLLSGDPLRSVDGETSFRAGEVGTLRLEEIETQYVLLWITELVLDDRHRAQISEAAFFGPGE
jgi:eukaryotic-like serine/threonine-protein kinase